MPAETPYTPQLGPAQPSGMPMASPADFGAGVGAGLAELGGALHESEVKAYRLQRALDTNAQRTDFAKKFAQARVDLDEARDKARMSPGTDADAYAKAAQDRYDAVTADLANGINDDAARGDAQSQIAADRAGYVSSEHAFATVEIAKSVAANFQQATDIAANRVEFGTDAAALPMEKLHALTSINDLAAPQSVKDALYRDTESKLDQANLRRTIKFDAHAALASIERGDYNRTIAPDDLNRLHRMAEVEVEKLAVADEKRKALDTAAQKEREATMLGDVGRGVAVDPKSLSDAAAAAEARGDTSKAHELRDAAYRSETNKVYGNGNATPDMMSARIAKIETDPKWRENPRLVAEHTQLLTLRNQQRTAEPPLAPLNFADPKAIAARVQQQGAWAQTHNDRMVVLGKDQAGELSNLAASGPAGRSAVAEQLAKLPGPWKVAAANQVAPNDHTLKAAMFLSGGLRSELFAGEGVARDNPKLTPRDDMGARWGERAGRALDGLPPDAVTTLKAAVDAIYAARAARKNLTAFDQTTYDQVVDDVLAANGRGAMSAWGGHPFVLPAGMTQGQMEKRLWAMAATFGAYYADGKTPIPKDVLLSNYHPVSTGRDGVYRWEDDQGRQAFARNRTPGEIDVLHLRDPRVIQFDPTAMNPYAQAGSAYGVAASEAGKRKTPADRARDERYSQMGRGGM